MSDQHRGGWHRQQDEMVDAILEREDEGLNSQSALWRVWVWGAARLFANGHLVNLRALKQSGDRFRLLDLGCGTGELTRELAEAFPNAEIIGIDSNRASIDRARSSPTPPGVRYIQGTFEDAKESGTFDVVVCSEVLEHVERPALLLSVAHALLAPGGFLSLSTPSGWMWWRPGLAGFWEFLNSPAQPRLRDNPRPSVVIERTRNVVAMYKQIRLRPQKNWSLALPYHPALHPTVVRRLLDRAGFEIVLRTSTLWYLDARFSVVHKVLLRLERRRPLVAAQRFFYFTVMLDGLMNLFPPLRAFETRQILLARKRAR